jgi:hypothetical protein
MRAASDATIAALMSGQACYAEMYDIELANSSNVLHYSGIDSPMTFDGVTYQTGFVITRGNLTQRLGLDEQPCDLTFAQFADQPLPALINGRTLQATADLGLLDQANITIWEAILADYSDTSPGLTHLFKGRVSQIKAGRLKTVITVTSGIALLDIDMPKNIVQPGCVHTLYDTGCGLLRSAFLVSGRVFTGTPGVQSFNTNLTQPDGYFNLGQIDCTEGVNEGLSRFVMSYLNAGGNVQLFEPWPSLPAAGDTFNISPGCNKSQLQCGSTNPAVGPAFDNIDRFGGDSYVPAVETLYDGGAVQPPAQTTGRQGTAVTGSPYSSNRGANPYVK